MKLKKEKSCGCIIIKDNKYLLVYEKVGKFWGFPKGHTEDGENEIDTALREVKEEVGIGVDIHTDKRYELNYIVNDEIDKTVILYIATPKEENIKKQESEIEQIKWCTYEEALEILTFDNWKEILKKVKEDLE